MESLPDVSSPAWFLIAVVIAFAIITGRYLLVAGIFYLIFYLWFPSKWKNRKIGQSMYRPGQFRKEVFWSTVTALIFSITAAVMIWLWQQGYTKLYLDPNTYPVWWLPLSLLISLIIHESYYYWLHRWMHQPGIFRVVHKVHHDSRITSPWTAFSFHPLEGLLQAVVLPLLLIFLPMNVYILLIQLTIMTLSSVINHLDIEIFPKKFHRHFLGKWVIGATHHALHHQQFKYNYGLYFTFWDKWRRTESPLFKKLFEEKTGEK